MESKWNPKCQILLSLAHALTGSPDEERTECAGFFSPDEPDPRISSYLGTKKCDFNTAAVSLVLLDKASLPQVPNGWKWRIESHVSVCSGWPGLADRIGIVAITPCDS